MRGDGVCAMLWQAPDIGRSLQLLQRVVSQATCRAQLTEGTQTLPQLLTRSQLFHLLGHSLADPLTYSFNVSYY